MCEKHVFHERGACATPVVDCIRHASADVAFVFSEYCVDDYSHEEKRIVVQGLVEHPGLRKLVLKHVSPDFVVLLCNAMSTSSHNIDCLDVRFRPSHHGIELIVDAIRAAKRCFTLKLRPYQGDSWVAPVFAQFAAMVAADDTGSWRLTRLVMRRQFLTNVAVDAVLKELPRLGIMSLDFTGADIGNEGARALFAAMRDVPELVDIRLFGNPSRYGAKYNELGCELVSSDGCIRYSDYVQKPQKTCRLFRLVEKLEPRVSLLWRNYIYGCRDSCAYVVPVAPFYPMLTLLWRHLSRGNSLTQLSPSDVVALYDELESCRCRDLPRDLLVRLSMRCSAKILADMLREDLPDDDDDDDGDDYGVLPALVYLLENYTCQTPTTFVRGISISNEACTETECLRVYLSSLSRHVYVPLLDSQLLRDIYDCGTSIEPAILPAFVRLEHVRPMQEPMPMSTSTLAAYIVSCDFLGRIATVDKLVQDLIRRPLKDARAALREPMSP